VLLRMDANSVRNMYSIIAVTNKHTAKLHHVGSLYILLGKVTVSEKYNSVIHKSLNSRRK
jgi:hypothetical protein